MDWNSQSRSVEPMQEPKMESIPFEIDADGLDPFADWDDAW